MPCPSYDGSSLFGKVCTGQFLLEVARMLQATSAAHHALDVPVQSSAVRVPLCRCVSLVSWLSWFKTQAGPGRSPPHPRGGLN
jgi:hypothetical protein